MDKSNNYLILPGCDDTNRGDQSLIWETVAIAREAGFKGRFYMVASKEKSIQSMQEGIYNIEYILKHPSTYFKKNNNIQYGKLLKMKWAMASVLDSIKAILLLIPFIRKRCKGLFSTEIRKSLEIYESASAAFVKGGGFLHAYGSFVETYVIFYNLYHIILAQSMGIPVYVMPNSYGPFKSLGSKWLVKKVFRKCCFIASREYISHQVMEGLNLNCKLFPDLAFYLEPDYVLNKEQQQRLEQIPFEEKSCVALTMRPYRFPSSKNPIEDYRKYKKTLCEFIQYLSREGYYPVLIEHTYSETEHERDMSCILDVVNLLQDSCEYAIYSDLTLNSRQLKYVYSKFEYIIGTRLHSIIFSIASGVSGIAITYGGNKGEGIMSDIGISEYSIPIDEMSCTTLIDKFSKIVNDVENVKERIQIYLTKLSVEKEQLIKILKDIEV